MMPAWLDRLTGRDLRNQLTRIEAGQAEVREEIRFTRNHLANLIKETTVSLRDDLSNAEGNLTTQIGAVQQGLTNLATYLQSLPVASDITDDDINQIKADGATLADVATQLGALAQPAQPTPAPSPEPTPDAGA